MKKSLAAFLAVALIFALSVPVLASAETAKNVIVLDGVSELIDTPLLITDIKTSNQLYTHFDERDILTKPEQTLIETAYQVLFDRIKSKGCMSVYWEDFENYPVTMVIQVEDLESYKSFSYLYWKDDDWYDLKHEFNDENKEVIMTIEMTGPIAIVATYGSAGIPGVFKTEGSSHFVGSVKVEDSDEQGTQPALKPNLINGEYFSVVPFYDVSLLDEHQLNVFQEGYRQLNDVVPEGMTTRYAFYLIADKENEAIFRMDDISRSDNVKCKMFNGSWKDLNCEVFNDGEVKVFDCTDGFYAIFTDIKG